MSKYCRNNLSTKIDEYTSFLLFTCGSVHAFKKILLNWGIIYIWCIMNINQIPVINGANANLYGGTYPLSR